MMNNALRQALLAAGFRCIGAEFNGSGDSGSLEHFVFPSESQRQASFDELMADDESQGSLDYLLSYDKELIDKIDAISKPYSDQQWDSGLEGVFYRVLENFPGDWVNNAGGYGKVIIDLQTGQWNIDGYERYESEEPAGKSGTMSFEPVATPQMDVLDLVKLTLTSSTAS